MAIEVAQPTPGEPPLHIEVSGLPRPEHGTVTAIVQRSTDGGVRWTTVRGLADVPVPPPAGLHLTGVDGDYASTPDHAALDVTGDISLRGEVTVGWSGDMRIIAKWDEDTQCSYALFGDDTGLYLIVSTDGTPGAQVEIASDSAIPGWQPGARLAVRADLDVDDGAGGHAASFYVSSSIDGPWTAIGSPVSGTGTISIHAGTAELAVGALSGGVGADAGVVHAVQVWSGLGGTIVADARFDQEPTGTTSFQDGVGREWTIHGSAEIITEPPITAKDWEYKPGVVNQYRAGLRQILDTFERVEIGEWGDSDTGQTWDTTEPGANAFVANGAATVTHATDGTTYHIFLTEPDAIGDVDGSVTFATNADGGITGNGTPGTDGVEVHFLARSESGGGAYSVTVLLRSDGLVFIAVLAADDNIYAISALPLTYTGAEVYRLRMRVDGHRIRGKCWDVTDPEPDWQVDVVPPPEARRSAGRLGLQTVRQLNNTNDGLTITFDDFVADIDQPQWIGGTASITPTLAQPWLCSVMRSFLNRPITIRSYEEPSRAPRGGQTPVAHRTLPIAQAELSGGREWTLDLRAADLSEARAIEWIAASGDVLWLLVPAGSPVPGGYYRLAQQYTARHHRQQGHTRWLTLPLTEVAAPGPDIVTAQSTWDTVIGQYGTWADVIAAVPTWEALLELVGDPVEVIVDD